MAANRVRSTALGYALLAPSLFGVVTFLLLPMLVMFWLSLHRWDLLGPIRYVGLDNWQSVLTDRSFATSLVVTLAFISMVVPVQTVLGLIAAAMLARGLPGSGFFRTLYVLPWICAPLAIAVLWRWILAPTDGAVSTLLGHRIEWLTDPGLALPVVSAVVVWTNVGYVTLFFLAGILAIPEDIHNAARTDGATAWQRFRRITLPMLRPTLFFVTVTGLISAAQVFDTVYALTGGGPQGRTDLVAHRIYSEAFGAAAVGRAAVMAVAAKRADLRFHDLRHTGAVLAAQTGATLAELMGRLGHSTHQAALRYQHVAAGRDQQIAEALSQIAKAAEAQHGEDSQ